MAKIGNHAGPYHPVDVQVGKNIKKYRWASEMTLDKMALQNRLQVSASPEIRNRRKPRICKPIVADSKGSGFAYRSVV